MNKFEISRELIREWREVLAIIRPYIKRITRITRIKRINSARNFIDLLHLPLYYGTFAELHHAMKP